MGEIGGKKLKALHLEPEKVQVLCTRLEDQAELLRTISRLNIGYFTGLSTGFAVISAWVFDHPNLCNIETILVVVLEVVFFAIFFKFITANELRRSEGIEIIGNIKEALKLTEPGYFIPSKALEPVLTPHRLGAYFQIGGIIIFAISIIAVLIQSSFDPC